MQHRCAVVNHIAVTFWKTHDQRNTGDSVMVLVSFSTNLHDPNGSDTAREQIL